MGSRIQAPVVRGNGQNPNRITPEHNVTKYPPHGHGHGEVGRPIGGVGSTHGLSVRPVQPKTHTGTYRIEPAFWCLFANGDHPRPARWLVVEFGHPKRLSVILPKFPNVCVWMGTPGAASIPYRESSGTHILSHKDTAFCTIIIPFSKHQLLRPASHRRPPTATHGRTNTDTIQCEEGQRQ